MSERKKQICTCLGTCRKWAGSVLGDDWVCAMETRAERISEENLRWLESNPSRIMEGEALLVIKELIKLREIATYNREREPLIDTALDELEWYGEQVRLCRYIHQEGDKGRQALVNDQGERAKEVLKKIREFNLNNPPHHERPCEVS